MSREYLPDRRVNRTVKARWEDQTFYLTVGFYDEELKRPGEVFADTGKTPQAVQQVIADACILISVALQFGVSAADLGKSLARFDNGKPYTIIGVICDLLSRTDWTKEETWT